MKKIMLAVLFLGVASVVKADPLCTNWGDGLNLCLPLTSLSGAYGYNFNAKERGNQALVETTVGTIRHKVSLTFGGAKSEGQAASPYLSATYGIMNPIQNDSNPLSWIKPGVYFGKHFDTREWIYGLKASAPIF